MSTAPLIRCSFMFFPIGSGGCLDDTIVERLAVDGDYEQVNLVTKDYAYLHIVQLFPLKM
jgi:hypothetical protein